MTGNAVEIAKRQRVVATSTTFTNRGRKYTQVLASAREELLLHGYERTTMDAVTSRAGVSKATVYSYFSSKDEMFAAVMLQEVEQLRQTIKSIDASPDKQSFPVRLKQIGAQILHVWLSPSTLTLLRTMIAAVDRFQNLATSIGRAAKEGLLESVAEAIETGARDGEILCTDPKKAAFLFVSLVGPDLLISALLEPNNVPDEDALRDHVQWCVDMLFRAYGASVVSS